MAIFVVLVSVKISWAICWSAGNVTARPQSAFLNRQWQVPSIGFHCSKVTIPPSSPSR